MYSMVHADMFDHSLWTAICLLCDISIREIIFKYQQRCFSGRFLMNLAQSRLVVLQYVCLASEGDFHLPYDEKQFYSFGIKSQAFPSFHALYSFQLHVLYLQ